jgi:cation transport regulator ChaB
MENYTKSVINKTNGQQCIYCGKKFAHKQSRSKHQNYRCKLRPEVTEQKEPQTIINNITSNDNRHVIVNINVYGKEEYKNMLTFDDWDTICELRGMKRLKKVLSIALGKQPNNTVAIPNMSQPYCLTMCENGPTKEYLPPIIQEIMDRLPKTLREIFRNFFNEQRQEYHPTVWEQDKAHAETIVKDIIEKSKNHKYKKETYNVIKTILYNNKLI